MKLQWSERNLILKNTSIKLLPFVEQKKKKCKIKLQRQREKNNKENNERKIGINSTTYIQVEYFLLFADGAIVDKKYRHNNI